MSHRRRTAGDRFLDALAWCPLRAFRLALRVTRPLRWWLRDRREAGPLIAPPPVPERPLEPAPAETTMCDEPFGPLRIRPFLDEPERSSGGPAEARGALVAMQAASQVLSWGWPR